VTTLDLSHPARAARILGTGSYQPERVVTNHDLTKIMDTSDEWIRTRVGILERRFCAPGEELIDMAGKAAENAIKDSGLTPSDMDTVIVATCTSPDTRQHISALVASQLGIPEAGAFDVNTVCSGFCYAIGVASGLIRSGSAGHVLVIGADKYTDFVDPTDRANAIIFADGAGAVVVGPAEEPGIGPVVWGSAGDLADTFWMRDNRWIQQDGQAVFRWATTQIAPVALRAIEQAGIKPSDIDVLIPHQANLRIVNAIAKKLHAEGAREDMVVADDIIHSGNTSAASIPMALDHMRDDGRVQSGDVALLVGFGAGLSYASQVVICP
jgi:3-oxoacyl-[acyl-carrier-protein] synthase-3